MDDKAPPPNSSAQIIRDIGETEKRKLPSSHDESAPENTLSRFETIPTNVMRGSSRAQATPKTTEKAQPKQQFSMTGENYQRVYQQINEQRDEEQQRLKLTQQKKIAQDQSSNEEALKKANEQKAAERLAEEKQRQRAKELKDEIFMWEQQRGQGRYDDKAIELILEPLNRELSEIPVAFQY